MWILSTRLLTFAIATLADILPCAQAGSTDEFELTATAADFGRYYPTYLANGYFSAFSSIRGTDATHGYLVGLMDYTEGDVSRPAAIPAWNEIDLYDGRQWLNAAAISSDTFPGYRQTLNLYDGVLTTVYRWKDGARQTQIAVRTFVSQDAPDLAASELVITPDYDGSIGLTFSLRPWAPPAHRLAQARLDDAGLKRALAAAGEVLEPKAPATPDRAVIWYPGEVDIESMGASEREAVVWLRGHAHGGLPMAESFAVALPPGLRPLSTRTQRDPQHLVWSVELSVRRGVEYRFAKFVAVWREGWTGAAEEVRQRVLAARAGGFDALLAKHERAWHELWRADIEVAGDANVQRAIHSDLFYLLENSTANTAWPMSACGFSPNYAGHVFWDSDSWVFPALLLLHPERARSLVMFRYRTLPEARQRAHQHGLQGAMYPWESDPERGTEQTPHFAWQAAEREIHVNADIAIAQWQYYLATGDRDWLERYGWPVIEAVAQFWSSRVIYNSTLRRYEILHVTSPDEAYNDVPNDSFTNLAARKALVIATEAARTLSRQPDPQWRRIARDLFVPFSTAEQRHLDFDPSVPHDRRTWMGSSLAWLAYPPLDAPMSRSVRRNDLVFALRALADQGNDPNDMLIVMLSVEEAEIGNARAAYEWLQRNLAGFLKPPFNVRSETVENNVGYLLSTSGGFLQNFVYGFSGLRIAPGNLAQAYDPVLPAAWPSLSLKNLIFRAQRFNVILNRDSRTQPRLSREPATD